MFNGVRIFNERRIIQMNLMQMTDMDLQRHANIVLIGTIEGLVNEGFLDNSKKEAILLNYSIIVENDSWMPKFLLKHLGIEPNKLIYRLVKRTKPVTDAPKNEN